MSCSRLIFALAAFSLSSCATGRKQILPYHYVEHTFSIGMPRDSVLDQEPYAKQEIFPDSTTLAILRPSDNFYLRFDSNERLNEITEINYFQKDTVNPNPSGDTAPFELHRIYESLVHQGELSPRQFAFVERYYLDSAKIFSLSANVRGWKAYWWAVDSCQEFVAFGKDSLIDDLQSYSSLSDSNRNTPFQAPGVSTTLYLPSLLGPHSTEQFAK